ADVVVLTCHPHQASEILGARGMQEAISGKLLVSMLGGVSVATLEDAIYVTPEREPLGWPRCHIVQAIANAAAAKKRSVTVVADKSAAIPGEVLELTMDVLWRIGDVVFATVDQMPAATALCASATAFFAWFLEAVIEGAVAEGIDKTEASRMAALTMAGTAELVLSGEDAATTRAKVVSPGGVTAVGLAVMERSGAKTTVIEALRTTASTLRSKSK
ncbi:pyrroline-5-carboxylate reductase dimerization-domain-containing protein, partial [Xylogone sp. PMI_703]